MDGIEKIVGRSTLSDMFKTAAAKKTGASLSDSGALLPPPDGRNDRHTPPPHPKFRIIFTLSAGGTHAWQAETACGTSKTTAAPDTNPILPSLFDPNRCDYNRVLTTRCTKLVPEDECVLEGFC